MSHCCRALSLDGCRHAPFIDDGLAALQGLAHVATLNLQGCITLTDIGLAAIAHMTSLQSINLQDCCAISGGLARRPVKVCIAAYAFWGHAH